MNSVGIAFVGPEGLLGEQLADVGERLQEAEGADPVGAVAVLEAADQLALDAPSAAAGSPKITAKITSDLTTMIQVASTKLGVGERQHQAASTFSISTWTGPPLSRALALPSAMPSARKQAPSGTRSLICDRGVDAGAVLADADLVAGLQAEALGVG